MVNINLLPAGQRRQANEGGQPWLIAAGALALLTLLSIVGLELYYGSQVGQLEDDLQEQQGIITALESAKKEYDSLLTEKTELEKVTEVARSLRDQKTYWSNDLAAFTAQLPAGDNLAINVLEMTPVTEQSLEMQQGGLGEGKSVGRTIAVEGTASSQQAVIDMLNAFESNPEFGVVFEGMQREEVPDGTEEYTFNADVGVASSVPVTNSTATAGAATAPAAAPAAPAAAPGGS